MPSKDIQDSLITLKQTEAPIMSIAEWRDYLFKRIELLTKRSQLSGMTSWALLTAIFFIFIRLGSVIQSKSSFDYMAMALLFYFAIGMFYCASLVLSKVSRQTPFPTGLQVLKDVEKRGVALLILLQLALVASELFVVIYNNYFSSDFAKINSYILVLILAELMIYSGTFLLLLSPFALAYSQTQPTRIGAYLQLFQIVFLFVTPVYFGYFAVYRLSANSELEWFYLETTLLLSCLWVLLIFLVKYRFERTPIQELENLLDEIVSGRVSDNKDIGNRIKRIFHGVDLREWIDENVSAARKITSTFGRKDYELQGLAESIPDECKRCDRANEQNMCAHEHRISKFKKNTNDLVASIDETLRYMRSALVFPLFYASPGYVDQSGCLATRKYVVEIISDLKKRRRRLLKEVKRQEKAYKAKLREVEKSKKELPAQTQK